jgi:hypothetical protein
MEHEIFLAYVAGIMDGEGCFRIEKKRPNAAQKSIKYTMMITLQMGEKAVMDHIASHLEITPLFINLQQWKYKDNQPRRPAYRIQLFSKRAADFIRLILPYLVGKKEQARLCLEFNDLISSQVKLKRKFTESELAIRDDYYERVTLLKHI